MDLEDILDRGWVRFLIHSLLTVALIGVSCWFYSVYNDIGLPKQYSGISILGMATFLGTLIIFIANDLMADSDGIGRIILSVLGGIIIIGAGGYATFGYCSIGWCFSDAVDADALRSASPWAAAFGGIHLLGGVIFCIIYYVLLYLDVDIEILYLLALPVAFALAYLFSVPFAFIYNASGALFFNGWTEMILAVIGIATVIVGHIREWEPIDFSAIGDSISQIRANRSEKRAQRKSLTRTRKQAKIGNVPNDTESSFSADNIASDRQHTSSDGESDVEENKKKINLKKYEQAAQSALFCTSLAYMGCHSSPGWIAGSQPRVTHIERYLVKIEGAFRCYVRSDQKDRLDACEAELEDVCGEIARNLRSKVISEINDVNKKYSEQYEVYDKEEWEVCVTIKGKNDEGHKKDYTATSYNA